MISLDALPPYSHSLERLVDNLESTGLDVQPLRELRLKDLSRMNSETRYPSDSDQARSVAEQVLAYTKNAIQA